MLLGGIIRAKIVGRDIVLGIWGEAQVINRSLARVEARKDNLFRIRSRALWGLQSPGNEIYLGPQGPNPLWTKARQLFPKGERKKELCYPSLYTPYFCISNFSFLYSS